MGIGRLAREDFKETEREEVRGAVEEVEVVVVVEGAGGAGTTRGT